MVEDQGEEDQEGQGNFDQRLNHWDSEFLRGVRMMQGMIRQFHELAECDDPECMICAIAYCPHYEPLHFHHDGCPACVFEVKLDHVIEEIGNGK